MSKKGYRIPTNRIGLVFGIVFSLLILLMAAFPLGKSPTSKDYIYIAIYSLYPLGLFIGLKWKGIGGLVCMAGFVSVLVIMISELKPGIKFNNTIFWVVLFFIQMIPVILYIRFWYHSWKLKRDRPNV